MIRNVHLRIFKQKIIKTFIRNKLKKIQTKSLKIFVPLGFLCVKWYFAGNSSNQSRDLLNYTLLAQIISAI